ncbi:amino acid permease [Atractiella rhizophila]|nr:amino acid permease [Atractiella rhizophila]
MSDIDSGKRVHDDDLEKKGLETANAYDISTEGQGDAKHQVAAGDLHRQLKNRHIAMISIGGVIGTGLFLGSGGALSHGGPLGLLLGYSIMGTICFSVMVALGEMVSHLPIAGGHITLATRFVDPAWSFTMGWNYWYNWTIVLPAEISAAAVLIHYWNDNSNLDPAWISIFLVVVWAINLGGARAYGEMEFWFASIKVITIVGLIIGGIVLTAGGGPSGESIGFRYWRDPGPFVQYLGIQGAKGRFLGFWAVLIQAGFSYIGTEITAIAAGEAKNPRRNLPRAIKRVYIRILLFYILGVFIIGLLCPSNDPALFTGSGNASSSPFVVGIKRAGVNGLPGVINAALLTSAWSAASSDCYTSSRALYAMSLSGAAPKFFRATTSWGLPYWCLLVSIAFSLLSYMAAGAGKAGEVFGWFANMTSVAGLLTWLGIFVTFIRWHQACKLQGFSRKALPFKAPFQPYLTYYGLFMVTLIIFFNGWAVFIHGHWDTATFVTSYIPVVLFVVLYVAYRLWNRTSFIALQDIDLYTGSRDIVEEEELPPRNFVEKFWRALM